MLHTQSVSPCFALTPPFSGHACCFVVKFQRLKLMILIKGDANTVLKHQSLYPYRPSVCLSMCWSGSDDSETTTSTSSVSCSPRWIVHPNMQGQWDQTDGVRPQQQCLDACVTHSSCVAVDYWFSNRECKLHDRNQTRHRNDDVTQFEIVRHCYAESSTWRHLFLYRIEMD